MKWNWNFTWKYKYNIELGRTWMYNWDYTCNWDEPRCGSGFILDGFSLYQELSKMWNWIIFGTMDCHEQEPRYGTGTLLGIGKDPDECIWIC